VRPSTPTGSQKRFALLRVGAPPVELTPGQPLYLGRSPTAGVTIPSQNVSRRHAEIAWSSGRPWIRDCGSSNGTLVNGEKLSGKGQPLQDGDEIVIGPLTATYRAVGADDEFGQVRKRLSTGRLGGPLMASVISGDLAKADLFEVLQTLELKQKTGTLSIKGRKGEGTIVLREGRPVFAALGDVQGPHAVLELLHWIEGTFELDPQITETQENVQVTIEAILNEAARRTTSERTTK
jgi:pSer/pThr/pTyr-binding forkhead associated (FHA) protein